MRRVLLTAALLLAGVAMSAAVSVTAAAADTVVVRDEGARAIAALDGTVVWISDSGVGHSTLWQRSPSGAISRVKGTPEVYAYLSIDLGHDERGKLVLTYLRCSFAGFAQCKSLRDDLHGHRASVGGLAVKSCVPKTGAAMWGRNAVYGLQCDGTPEEIKRSGVYIKTKGHAPRRVKIAREIKAGNVQHIHSVDIRGTRIAVELDSKPRAFSQALDGSRLRAFVASPDGSGILNGLSLDRGAQWVLSRSGDAYSDSPSRYFVVSYVDGCRRMEELPPPGLYAPEDIAVDASRLYFAVPYVGIVRHTFAPAPPNC